MTRPLMIDFLAQWHRRAIELRAAGNYSAAAERDTAARELREWWDSLSAEALAPLSNNERKVS